PLLKRLVRLVSWAREDAPRILLDRELSPLPCTTTHGDRGMVDRELVGPGGEAREPTEVVETPEHGEQRVGGGLLRDVLEIPAQVRVRRPPAAGLESGGTEEQRV